MLDLEHKRFVIFGVANDKSLCWAIVEALQKCKAEVILVYHPSNGKRVLKLAEEAGIPNTFPCDVEDGLAVDECFKHLAKSAPYYGVVHGIAFSDKEQLKGRFIDTTRFNFLQTMTISCFSFVEIARRMEILMPEGGSMITLTFDASRGTYPNYNVMGVAKGALEVATRYLARDLGEKNIRVNALSPSPEDTLSARGISNFRRIGDFAEAMSPMGRRATLEEVGSAALFLLSDMSGGMTGQTMLVDCGAGTSIMPPPRNAGKMAEAMSKIAEVYREEANSGDRKD